jgi:hypothetical protein
MAEAELLRIGTGNSTDEEGDSGNRDTIKQTRRSTKKEDLRFYGKQKKTSIAGN